MKRFPLIFTLLSSLGLSAEEIYSYADHAKPIFSNVCNNCHNPDKKKGGLDLSTYAGVMAGGSGGDVVSPGDADGSKLLRCVLKLEEPFMPPKGDRLGEAEVETLRKWIAGGLRETKSGSARSASPKKKAASFTAGTIGKPEILPVLFPNLPLAPARVTHRPAPVLALASNPWSPILAVGAPGQVVFYDTDTLAPKGVLAFAGVPRVLAFSSSGAVLFAAGGEAGKQGRVAAWTIANAQLLLGFEAEMDEILAADLRPDLGEVALGGSARKVRFVNSLGEKQDENKKHTEWITASVYSPDGVLLATADRNGGVRVWEAPTRNELHELRGHDKFITGVSWRPDSNVLATVSEDGTARLWEMAGGTSTKKWDAHVGGATDVSFAPDGTLATVGRNNSLKLWEGDGKLRREYKNLPGLPLRVRFSSDSKRVFVGDLDGRILIFEPAAKSETFVAQLGARLPSLEERVAQAEGRVSDLKTLAAGGVTAAQKQADEALEAGKREMAKAESERDAAKAAVLEMEKKFEETRAQLTEGEKRLQALAEGKTRLAVESGEASRAVETAKAERDRLKEVSRQAVERLARADSELTQAGPASPERARLAEAQAKADRESREAGIQLSAAVKVAEAAELKLGETGQKLSLANKEHQLAEQALAAVKTASDSLKAGVEKAKGAIAPVEQVVVEAKGKLSALEKTADSLRAASKTAPEELPGAEKELARWKSEKLKYLWWKEFERLQGLLAEQPGEGEAPADSPEVAAQKARVAEAEKAWKSSAPQS